MVSHPVVVAATSPVVPTATHPPTTTTIPPLMTSLSIPPPKTNTYVVPEQTKLGKLFELGTKRFCNGLDDNVDHLFDKDEFAIIYLRTLQAALRGSALRNQTLARKLKNVRSANAKMRAVKCEERLAAQRRAAAAAKIATSSSANHSKINKKLN